MPISPCPESCEAEFSRSKLGRGGRHGGTFMYIMVIIIIISSSSSSSNSSSSSSSSTRMAAEVCPISLLRLSLLRLLDSSFPGKPRWAWEFHPLNLRFCLSQTLEIHNRSTEIGRTGSLEVAPVAQLAKHLSLSMYLYMYKYTYK